MNWSFVNKNSIKKGAINELLDLQERQQAGYKMHFISRRPLTIVDTQLLVNIM